VKVESPLVEFRIARRHRNEEKGKAIMSVLVNRQAPDFTAPAVMPDGSIQESFKLSELRGKHVVLFFWPLDFTFVCPTEILAHDHRIAQFQERGVGPVRFPIVADVSHTITRAFGVEHAAGRRARKG